MVVIALLLSAALPNFRNMQTEAQRTKAKSNMDTLMKGVEAYAASPRSTGMSKYPDGTDIGNQANWAGTRTAGSGWQTNHLMVQYGAGNTLGTTGPIISSEELFDPFSPPGTNLEYGYYVNAQGFYIIWSNGLNRVNINCTVNNVGVINAPGSAIYVSNGH
jgi:type II secretory pathway pseudopilin PulG